MLLEESAKLTISEEDKKYREIASTTLMNSEGIENTYPLKAAVAAKSIDLLPAGGFRV